jgi:hypothetical protein
LNSIYTMHKPFYISIIFCLAFVLQVDAQRISKEDRTILLEKQDSLSSLGLKLVEAQEAGDRFRADSLFTRVLVRSLKVKNSFYFPFDSLITISRIYSPDSAFRVFTWQVSKDENTHRRHGAIQIKTAEGNLKLFPLVDRSYMIENQVDTITNNEWWIGSIYYKIIKKDFQGKPFYTMLGFDENSIRSTKKRIEVMHFNESGLPVLGGNFFSFAKDTIPKKSQSRFWIEYKKDGNGRVLYDEDLDIIIYDHLISETNEPAKKYTFIPDGDYEAFKWINGQWQHIEKVFTSKLKDGEAPVEKPVTESKLKKGKG